MFTENGRVNDYLKFMSEPVFRRLSSYPGARLYTFCIDILNVNLNANEKLA